MLGSIVISLLGGGILSACTSSILPYENIIISISIWFIGSLLVFAGLHTSLHRYNVSIENLFEIFNKISSENAQLHSEIQSFSTSHTENLTALCSLLSHIDKLIENELNSKLSHLQYFFDEYSLHLNTQLQELSQKIEIQTERFTESISSNTSNLNENISTFINISRNQHNELTNRLCNLIDFAPIHTDLENLLIESQRIHSIGTQCIENTETISQTVSCESSQLRAEIHSFSNSNTENLVILSKLLANTNELLEHELADKINCIHQFFNEYSSHLNTQLQEISQKVEFQTEHFTESVTNNTSSLSENINALEDQCFEIRNDLNSLIDFSSILENLEELSDRIKNLDLLNLQFTNNNKVLMNVSEQLTEYNQNSHNNLTLTLQKINAVTELLTNNYKLLKQVGDRFI